MSLLKSLPRERNLVLCIRETLPLAHIETNVPFQTAEMTAAHKGDANILMSLPLLPPSPPMLPSVPLLTTNAHFAPKWQKPTSASTYACKEETPDFSI